MPDVDEAAWLRAALREELANLWTDLQTARRSAYNGAWSMHCDSLKERIVALTHLVGPTPWEQADPGLFRDRLFQRIHEEIGVPVEVDEVKLATHLQWLDDSARV